MKRLLSLFIALTIILSAVNGFAINVSADESGYAWVLVDTYQFPIPEDFKPGDPWSYFASLEGNTAELQTTIPYGLGAYASKDESNPGNLHVKYTWSNPPTIIQANETISIAFEQEVFSNRTGNFGVAISPFLSLDVADLIGLGYGTASGVEAKVIYEDGTETRWFGIGYGQDDRSQTSCSANMSLKFKDKGSAGDRWALYIGAYAGPPGKVGVRYTYEWKQISNPTTITVTASTAGSSDLGKYSWEGEWDSNWGKMILTQNGPIVTGTYTHDKGRINGTISGNVLTGTWSESPSYAPPNDSGEIEFTMSADGKGFSGKWRYGSEGSWGNWEGGKRITEVKLAPTNKAATPTSPTPTGSNSAEAFESGSRIMWQPSSGLGYRLYRSTSQSSLGISVTDFYITSTSYADVNVEPNTTYYYTVKPVLAEANPFQGIEEKLGNAIAAFVIKTGNQLYKPGSFKHFIMLKLESPNMSVDGINQEVDPGRGTTPLVIAGRTMVPIRAVVEAMGGTVEWDGSTQKITLKARGNTVVMWMGKTDITVNGANKKMDVAPASKNNRTFVPVRFAAENLNCKVDWINSTKEAVIVYEE
ncbi:copper amine oxidase N-terminal domain-containing protein [Lutispora sp.]|uniref:copper amine oxidase N-terminal domain-containing protein n=1 Tax=Lutispora sp. TaxID=2828727 RepID=UPI002B1EB378|nr:copper amine oxidase N-terminal domain-containing protein [Lutispora sp.]MEA4960771.1 copper amine oxidase N-terminal domain-containing protein [Lutispora sp.]